MSSTEPAVEPISPLRDVWLRPRRVFRELASTPVGVVDYVLGAAQGVAAWLTFLRAQDAGATDGVAQIFAKALLLGSVVGVANLLLMGMIYARLGTLAGGASKRNQVVHVLAYGGVPVVASLLVWLFTALLAGEATFFKTPPRDVEGFVALLLHAQFIAYVVLTLWSVVLQVMGLSEIQRVANRRAFAVFVLGQILAILAALFFLMLISTLAPNLAPNVPTG